MGVAVHQRLAIGGCVFAKRVHIATEVILVLHGSERVRVRLQQSHLLGNARGFGFFTRTGYRQRRGSTARRQTGQHTRWLCIANFSHKHRAAGQHSQAHKAAIHVVCRNWGQPFSISTSGMRGHLAAIGLFILMLACFQFCNVAVHAIGITGHYVLKIGNGLVAGALPGIAGNSIGAFFFKGKKAFPEEVAGHVVGRRAIGLNGVGAVGAKEA